MVDTDDPLLHGAVTLPQHEETLKMLRGGAGEEGRGPGKGL